MSKSWHPHPMNRRKKSRIVVVGRAELQPTSFGMHFSMRDLLRLQFRDSELEAKFHFELEGQSAAV